MVIGIPATFDDFPRMNLGIFIEHDAFFAQL